MLIFNDETGEWYTLDDETPLDANGNPIIPGGGTVSGTGTKVDVGSTAWLKGISDLLKGTGPLGTGGQLVGLAGAAALLKRLSGGDSGPSGYQGGIPQYTMERTQTPISQQRPAGYRPGQGGITYFSPTTYTPTGADLGSTPASPTPTSPPAKTPEVVSAASGGQMPGGIAMLAGGGGRFLRGAGDGVSDSIPATIAGKQPARLADGEFVIDARTVSEIGNGSSEAGARKLYEMMERVHQARRKAKRGKPSNADKYLPK